MSKKIRQIDITEALEVSKKGEKVYVITFAGKPIIKSFNNMSVGEVLKDDSDYIFIVFEEA